MFRSWKLGTAFGIGIYVHWSFLLLPAWAFLSNLGVGGLPLALYVVALLVTVFGCVVLHELGHALMARYFGIGTRDITLYPIGGVARLERMSERPWEEFWIALAGPAVNVAIAGLLALALGAFSFSGLLLHRHAMRFSETFLGDLLLTNVMLVAFNLLPAFPMDGGRVLRALLATRLNRLRATEIAARAGIVVAVLMGLAGLYFLNSVLLLVIAAFTYFAGQQELAALRRRNWASHAEPTEVISAEATNPSAASGPAAWSGFTWDAQRRVWVLWQQGRPVATFWAHPE
jgi:Zn-dependent protease